MVVNTDSPWIRDAGERSTNHYVIFIHQLLVCQVAFKTRGMWSSPTLSMVIASHRVPTAASSSLILLESLRFGPR